MWALLQTLHHTSNEILELERERCCSRESIAKFTKSLGSQIYYLNLRNVLVTGFRDSTPGLQLTLQSQS